MNVPAKKAVACLLFLLFVQALLVSDFALVKKNGAGAEKAPCVLSFDVCGHGHPAAAFDGADLLAALPYSHSFIPSFDNYFPPVPEEAVATAEPGETGKPPKAC